MQEVMIVDYKDKAHKYYKSIINVSGYDMPFLVIQIQKKYKTELISMCDDDSGSIQKHLEMNCTYDKKNCRVTFLIDKIIVGSDHSDICKDLEDILIGRCRYEV